MQIEGKNASFYNYTVEKININTFKINLKFSGSLAGFPKIRVELNLPPELALDPNLVLK